MPKLLRLNDIENRRLLDKLAENDILVYEDVQGHTIFVNWNGKEWSIKAKSLSNQCITLVDLAMQKVYGKAYEYLQTLDSRVTSLLNKDHWYCFEYFYDEQPANIKYDRMPKNNLILTCIVKIGKTTKYTFDINELREYANLLDCDTLPILFEGRINSNQIKLIEHFLNTSASDLEFVFDETNFAQFFYQILNPNADNSFLMKTNSFQDNLEKIIIRFTEDDDETSMAILNPLYKKISDTNTTEHAELYSLILLNFLEYCQLVDLTKLNLKGTNRSELYLDAVCKLFNMYAKKLEPEIESLDIVVPVFFKEDKFKINTGLIDNKITKNYIAISFKFEYIFKTILGSFSKKKKKPIGVFSESTLIYFNDFVELLNKTIDKILNYNTESDLMKNNLMNFSDFFDIKYNTDADGKVYINDVYDKFAVENGDSKKKGDKFSDHIKKK